MNSHRVGRGLQVSKVKLKSFFLVVFSSAQKLFTYKHQKKCSISLTQEQTNAVMCCLFLKKKNTTQSQPNQGCGKVEDLCKNKFCIRTTRRVSVISICIQPQTNIFT